MKNIPALMVVLGVAVLTGCSTSFSGDISFRNRSDREIWVADVQGAKRILPCGILIPGAHKGEMMDRMPIPKEVVLLWSYTIHQADKRSVVVLPEALPPAKDSELQFVFTAEQVWIARWRNRGEPL
jgi:hypothetical protein